MLGNLEICMVGLVHPLGCGAWSTLKALDYHVEFNWPFFVVQYEHR